MQTQGQITGGWGGSSIRLTSVAVSRTQKSLATVFLKIGLVFFQYKQSIRSREKDRWRGGRGGKDTRGEEDKSREGLEDRKTGGKNDRKIGGVEGSRRRGLG